ncbi:hypothetical protein SLS62_005782 [Diatrype stigma]|uniref:Uncharacterized protein n=1 Tax=Diatrype stigma TaxID=117547 RepID=A0AAN9UQX3_9PEZI
MQFTMKNVFTLAAIVGTVVASPTQVPAINIRARDVIGKLEKFLDAGINMPPNYKPFNGTGLRPEGEIAIVQTEDEAAAFSQHHGHQVRIDAFQGELIYVLVSGDAAAPTQQHVGTLRGAYLDQTVDKIEHKLKQQELKAADVETGTSPATSAAADPLKAEAACSQTWCGITWQCIYFDRNCHGCIVFWCS